MSDEAERIRQQMQNVRQEMGHEVKGILQGAKDLADWRYYVRRHPWACVGAAFAAGFMLTPARKKVLGAEAAGLVEQLRQHGVAVTGLAAAGPSGIAGKLLAAAGPLILRNAASLIAQRFGGAAVPQASSPEGEP